MMKETDRQMKETDRELKEMMKETDRQKKETDHELKEMMKETDRQMKETDRELKEMMKETDRKIKETNRQIGELGGRFGDLVEHIVAPNLAEKFNSLGFNFGKMGTDIVFKDSQGKFIAEVDIMLENGDAVMVVEVKSKLTVTYVREHIARMKKLRVYSDEHGDKRQLLGTVAAAVVPQGVKEFVVKNGFYLIEQSGDTLKIDVPEGFVPYKW
jgi:hypothetical protein